MDFSRLKGSEYLGFVGAGVLFLSLFLSWFSTEGNGRINGVTGPSAGSRDFTAWDTYGVLDYLLTAACIAPFVLAYLIVRGAELSWRPGEITMIVGMVAFSLILLNGIVLGRPGEPSSEISLKLGYLVGLLGALGITAGGLIRQAQGGRRRKPPGSL